MKKREKQKKMTDEELRDWYDKTSMFDQGIIRPVKVTFAKNIKIKIDGPRRLVALRSNEPQAECLPTRSRLAGRGIAGTLADGPVQL